MPGVFAVVALEPLDQAPCQRLTELLREEPWLEIQQVLEVGGRVLLGRASNGILNARQPARLSSRDGERTCFIDGEIYNRAELWSRLGAAPPADSNDADLLLRLLATGHPREWIHRCRGSFLFVIWDASRRRLFAGNDRWGLRPHYWTWDGKRLVLGPRVRFALEVSGARRDLNFRSVTEYFAFQCMFDDRTFFTNVSTFPYASTFTFDVDAMTLSVDRYWDFDRIEPRPGVSFDAAADELAHLFARAVREQCDSDHRLGVMLSGGMDSRMILAVAARHHPQLQAFTFSLPGGRDLSYASELCRLCKVQHHTDVFTSGRWVRDNAAKHLELTEGFHCLFHMHGFQMRHRVREACDVNLSGYLGDLVLGGSLLSPQLVSGPPDWLFLLRSLYAQCAVIQGIGFPYNEEFRQLFTPGAWSEVRKTPPAQCLEEAAAGFQRYPFANAMDYFHIVNRGRKMIAYFLVFAAPYFEHRTPFFDYSFFDYALGVPTRYRVERGLQTAVLERISPGLAKVPRTDTGRPATLKRGTRWVSELRLESLRLGNRLTRGRFFRPQTAAYQDYRGWLRTDLRDWAQDILMDGRTVSRGILNPAFVESSLTQHAAGSEDCTWKIGTMLSFELMLRQLADAR